jgi:hypothetical protein
VFGIRLSRNSTTAAPHDQRVTWWSVDEYERFHDEILSDLEDEALGVTRCGGRPTQLLEWLSGSQPILAAWPGIGKSGLRLPQVRHPRRRSRERDRTEERIRRAIQASTLPRSVRIYVKGSYANNTNVRRDADVDIAVEWANTQIVSTWGDTAGLSPAELGYQPVSETTSPAEFRLQVEQALVSAFGPQRVDTTPNKHIGVPADSRTLDADVVPCFALARYDVPRSYHRGHRIYPKAGPYVDNYPQQNYDNGVRKNELTRRRYKEIVRCMKRLLAELYDIDVVKQDYPGYLTECLVYNAPNNSFGHVRSYEDVRDTFAFLWNGLRDPSVHLTWTEPSELLMLFRGRQDRIPHNAWVLVDKAWDWIGAT